MIAAARAPRSEPDSAGRANAFALSLCGRFVVERHPGEIYPNVMAISEANGRQRSAERQAATYERDADLSDRKGMPAEAEISRGMARISLTIAADLAEALEGAQMERAA